MLSYDARLRGYHDYTRFVPVLGGGRDFVGVAHGEMECEKTGGFPSHVGRRLELHLLLSANKAGRSDLDPNNSTTRCGVPGIAYDEGTLVSSVRYGSTLLRQRLFVRSEMSSTYFYFCDDESALVV